MHAFRNFQERYRDQAASCEQHDRCPHVPFHFSFDRFLACVLCTAISFARSFALAKTVEKISLDFIEPPLMWSHFATGLFLEAFFSRPAIIISFSPHGENDKAVLTKKRISPLIRRDASGMQ